MIPKTIHFIFGLASDFGGKPFCFVHYMAVKSAAVCNPDYTIRFYCKYEPTGMYWDVAKRYMQVVIIEPPEEIEGNRLYHVAHQADVVRMRLLAEEGGIYLDLDTITVKPFDSLLDNQVVLGLQGRGSKIDGLCNAVMLASPRSAFMQRWLGTYKTFRSKGRDVYWDEHSVRIPLRLAREYPEELTVLDRGAFFYPSADKRGIIDLFVDDKAFPAAYCHHLWEGLAWGLVSSIDERNVNLIDTSYNRMARRFVGDDAERFATLRAAHLAQLISEPIRLNLGCGSNRRPGWVNVDSQAAASPDLQFDIGSAPWPLPDGSVVEVEASHVLEHVGTDFKTVMQELYRVCRPDAVVRVKLPHPRHDWFVTDPTHNLPLLPGSLRMLDAELCKLGLLSRDTTSPLALFWGVDFETTATKWVPSAELRGPRRYWLLLALAYPFMRRLAKLFVTRDQPWRQRLEAETESQMVFLSRYMNNAVGEVQIGLRVRKGGPAGVDEALPSAAPIRLQNVPGI